SPPRPGRPHLVLRPPPLSRSLHDRLSPPHAACPPRVVTCSPPWSSPSPARTATPTSACPLAQPHPPTARPRSLRLTRRQSSANPPQAATTAPAPTNLPDCSKSGGERSDKTGLL